MLAFLRSLGKKHHHCFNTLQFRTTASNFFLSPSALMPNSVFISSSEIIRSAEPVISFSLNDGAYLDNPKSFSNRITSSTSSSSRSLKV